MDRFVRALILLAALAPLLGQWQALALTGQVLGIAGGCATSRAATDTSHLPGPAMPHEDPAAGQTAGQ